MTRQSLWISVIAASSTHVARVPSRPKAGDRLGVNCQKKHSPLVQLPLHPLIPTLQPGTPVLARPLASRCAKLPSRALSDCLAAQKGKLFKQHRLRSDRVPLTLVTVLTSSRCPRDSLFHILLLGLTALAVKGIPASNTPSPPSKSIIILDPLLRVV